MRKWIKKLDEWEEKSKLEFENLFRQDFNLVKYVEDIWDICESFEIEFIFRLWIREPGHRPIFFSSSEDDHNLYCRISHGTLETNKITLSNWQNVFRYMELNAKFQLDIQFDGNDNIETRQKIGNRIDILFPEIKVKTSYKMVSCIITP